MSQLITPLTIKESIFSPVSTYTYIYTYLHLPKWILQWWHFNCFFRTKKRFCSSTGWLGIWPQVAFGASSVNVSRSKVICHSKDPDVGVGQSWWLGFYLQLSLHDGFKDGYDIWHIHTSYTIIRMTYVKKATMVSIHNFSNQPGPDVKWILNQQRHFWFSTLQVTSLVAMNISKGSWLAICVHVSPILMLDSLLHWKF